MSADYTTLSLADMSADLDAMARDAAAAFGTLDARQLNWKPDETRWSVAQCLDHLLSANRGMLQSSAAALDPAAPKTIWQRLPVLPRTFGRLLIRSQSPSGARKFVAPAQAQPSASTIDGHIVEQFVAHQHELAARVRSLDATAARAVMVSPFVSFITYSILDGFRIVVAHQRRHFEQARRVIGAPGFPV